MSPIERRVTSAIVWLSLLCCAVLIGSGVFLMFGYTPETAKAYGDIESLHTDVAFGLLVRNLHRWFGMLLYPCLVGLMIAATVGLVPH
jgi:quinol-cytochrome oxidoreductase complex cytochrome b subunit